jgi:hypothetical protein
MEIAGVPKAVQGEFILGSPVDARPNGAGPTAAGDKITGVALYSSATRVLHSAMSENGWHRHAATMEALLAAGTKAPKVTYNLEARDAVRDVLWGHATR